MKPPTHVDPLPEREPSSTPVEGGGCPAPIRGFRRPAVVFLAILACATALRMVALGRASLWFDEVVTMNLARTKGPAELIDLLRRIDATRAPLHPLLLQGWIALFGPSDTAGRAFSVLCGVLTVAVVYRVGRLLYDEESGLVAAWLCAWSPLMVEYSRETRMYAWLALVTCVAWWMLFSFRGSSSAWRRVVYVLSLAALVYSHPLGVLMGLSLGLAAFLGRSTFRLSPGRWLALHFGAALLVLPWIPQYVDHPPSYIVGQLPLRFLFGLPIGFVGGDFRVLLGCTLLIAIGLWGDCRSRRDSEANPPDRRTASASLLIWFLVPPLLLYGYSRLSHPIFGPSRYTLFVGPAYLLLLTRGLARLPTFGKLAGLGGALALSGVLLGSMVYAPDLKADWRSAAAYLDRHDPDAAIVVVNVRVDAPKYYLGPGRKVVLMPADSNELAKVLGSESSNAWFAFEFLHGRPTSAVPTFLSAPPPGSRTVDFARLRLVKVAQRAERSSGSPQPAR